MPVTQQYQQSNNTPHLTYTLQPHRQAIAHSAIRRVISLQPSPAAMTYNYKHHDHHQTNWVSKPWCGERLCCGQATACPYTGCMSCNPTLHKVERTPATETAFRSIGKFTPATYSKLCDLSTMLCTLDTLRKANHDCAPSSAELGVTHPPR
jgi:hypothetical protein